MENPLVTVCLLTYNSQKYIQKTLDSLSSQDYLNIEIIISDNGSTDNTLEILERFIKKNKSKKIIFRKNCPDFSPGKFYDGCYDNCNGCIKSGLINGKYVSFWHSDDIYDKNIISKQTFFLQKNDRAAAVFSLGKIINQSGKKIGKFRLPKNLKQINLLMLHDIAPALLKYGNTFIVTPTFMAKKEIFNEIGPFHSGEKIDASGDLEMWLRILEKYPIGILNENLINYRTSPKKSWSHESAGFFRVMDGFLSIKKLNIQKNFLESYEFKRDLDNVLRAYCLLSKNDFMQAKRLISSPFSPKLLYGLFKNFKVLNFKIFALKLLLFIRLWFYTSQ